MKVVTVDNIVAPATIEEGDDHVVAQLAGHQIKIEKDDLLDAGYLVLWRIGEPGMQGIWCSTTGDAEILKVITKAGEEISFPEYGIYKEDEDYSTEGPLYAIVKAKKEFVLYWEGKDISSSSLSKYSVEFYCFNGEWGTRREIKKSSRLPIKI